MIDYFADYFGSPGGDTTRDLAFSMWMRKEIEFSRLPGLVKADIEIARAAYIQMAGRAISLEEMVGEIQLASLLEATRLTNNGEFLYARRFLSNWF